jgi:hypothetical protein
MDPIKERKEKVKTPAPKVIASGSRNINKARGCALFLSFLFVKQRVQPPAPVLIPRFLRKKGDLRMNIVQFREYCNENFEVARWGETIRDSRKRPQISAPKVFGVLMEMPALGQRSLLAVDEFARSPEAKVWHESHRKMVVSDTTLTRVAESMEPKSIREAGYRVIRNGDEQALWDRKLPSGKRIRMGILDGHHAGGLWASVLTISGKTEGVVDLERYPGYGHELSGSRRLLKRSFRTLGPGFFNVVAADALYADHEDFELCLAHGSHLLVKTEEETLTVIQDARHLFSCPKSKDFQGIGHVQGLDCTKAIEYEVFWTEGMDWQGIPLTVAWVKERHLKPAKGRPEHSEFWVLTTATGFTGEDLREMAHARWHIENLIFRRLNALVNHKRYRGRHLEAMETLLRIWMIGLTLLGAYLYERGWHRFEQTWETMKKTWRAVAEQMRFSLLRFCT